MPSTPLPRLALAAFFAGVVLVAIFVTLLLRFRVELRNDVREKIIGRDASVLFSVALQQIAEAEAAASTKLPAPRNSLLLPAILRSAPQRGMLAVAIFDSDGDTLQSVPADLLFVELPVDDYIQLLEKKPISRYHPKFSLGPTFAGSGAVPTEAPVLEVLLPLHGRNPDKLVGFARYYIDARPLTEELTAIDDRLNRQTGITLSLGTCLISGVIALAAFALNRAQRTIEERNDRLARTHFELTLAAKASALGQIASHLIHGLQGPVAGLRAVVSSHGTERDPEDWQSAAGYTDRLQAMIEETVALLTDAGARAHYEFTGSELAVIIRDRNAATARDRGVLLHVGPGFDATVDSHRGGLICLIAANLVHNAIAASAPGLRVDVDLTCAHRTLSLTVSDEGSGIPEHLRANLFEAGRSGREGGSGLGLAISRLLARQIGADLFLVRTGTDGTVFRLTLPLST